MAKMPETVDIKVRFVIDEAESFVLLREFAQWLENKAKAAMAAGPSGQARFEQEPWDLMIIDFIRSHNGQREAAPEAQEAEAEAGGKHAAPAGLHDPSVRL
jgi:hypothetical protein